MERQMITYDKTILDLYKRALLKDGNLMFLDMLAGKKGYFKEREKDEVIKTGKWYIDLYRKITKTENIAPKGSLYYTWEKSEELPFQYNIFSNKIDAWTWNVNHKTEDYEQ